uniref:Immunoglobulin domain-containing protein n=1 Tax=Pundamilia nyererei TaxID=303518 RepID=A0A3B4H017_9CICH
DLSLLVLRIALRCVTCEAGVIHVTGYVGREVNVSCSYDEGYESYEKYLCKNDCGDSDLLITTSNSSKNKYSIHDNKTSRIFTTTISDLHSVDAGKYWCGVTRTGKDIYTEVDCCDTVTKVQSYEGYSESVSCPYESQNSLKYICRGNRPSTCLQQALITSDTKQNGRFRLDDDKMSGTFTVTINSLTRNDSGSYLCGVQRNSELDVFSAVELEVEGKKNHSNSSLHQHQEDIICCQILMVSFTVMYTWTCLHSNIDANIDANEVQPLCILCIFRSR